LLGTQAGNIYKHPNSCELRAESTKDLKIVISHFEIFYLITQKRADYELFKQVFYLIQNKEHLTSEGLKKLLQLEPL
jgi:hypothetical protein